MLAAQIVSSVLSLSPFTGSSTSTLLPEFAVLRGDWLWMRSDAGTVPRLEAGRRQALQVMLPDQGTGACPAEDHSRLSPLQQRNGQRAEPPLHHEFHRAAKHDQPGLDAGRRRHRRGDVRTGVGGRSAWGGDRTKCWDGTDCRVLASAGRRRAIFVDHRFSGGASSDGSREDWAASAPPTICRQKSIPACK